MQYTLCCSPFSFDEEGFTALTAPLLACADHYAANGQKLKLYGREEDMTLSADKSKWLEVKLEYHHDMTSPQLDIVVKYADLNNNSYNKTVAASLEGVNVYDLGADPYKFSAFDIICESENGGKVFVDDMYIRNVLVP